MIKKLKRIFTMIRTKFSYFCLFLLVSSFTIPIVSSCNEHFHFPTKQFSFSSSPRSRWCAKCKQDPDSYLACWRSAKGCTKCDEKCCSPTSDQCCCMHWDECICIHDPTEK